LENVTVDALVIGGGIAGMQAALDLGDQGYKVALVEKDPSIGGKMITLSKVFPTLDCCSCITTPISNYSRIVRWIHWRIYPRGSAWD
jgi:heterodisulfide reductase subunit A